MKVLREYFKWVFRKEVVMLIIGALYVLVPFTILFILNSTWSITWFIFSEITFVSFGIFYFCEYKNQGLK